MKQEDKDLLLRDLCARLPYGVRILYDLDKKFEDGLVCQPSGLTKYDNRTCLQAFGVIDPMELDEIKPYLRSMSSMTEEEVKELLEIDNKRNIFSSRHLTWHLDGEVIDYLNKKMFDWRGLIEKGLALEAPEGIYNIKEK